MIVERMTFGIKQGRNIHHGLDIIPEGVERSIHNPCNDRIGTQ